MAAPPIRPPPPAPPRARPSKASRPRSRRSIEPPEGEGEAEGEAGEEANISLAAMEQELLPSVLETFDKIAATFKKLDKLQDKRLETVERAA